jgi:hypothetical protein
MEIVLPYGMEWVPLNEIRNGSQNPFTNALHLLDRLLWPFQCDQLVLIP